MLAASCGKDIDDNCRGVNFDATRLKECLGRNQDVVSAKCKADYPQALGAIQQRITARTSLVKLCNWELKRLCGEVREDPVKGLQCLFEVDQEGDPELQQGDQRSGVSLMPGVNRLRGIGLLLGALALFRLADGGGARANGHVVRRHHRKACRRSRVGYRPGRLEAAGCRSHQGEGGCTAAKAAAARATTDETAANPFRHRVRPGLVPDPAGLLSDDRQHRRCIDRSEIAALPLSDRRSRRIRRPARPQSDPEPAAR